MFRYSPLQIIITVIFAIVFLGCSLLAPAPEVPHKISLHKAYYFEKGNITWITLKGAPFSRGWSYGEVVKNKLPMVMAELRGLIPPLPGGRLTISLLRGLAYWKLHKLLPFIPEDIKEEINGLTWSSKDVGTRYDEVLMTHVLFDLVPTLGACLTFGYRDENGLIVGRTFEFEGAGSAFKKNIQVIKMIPETGNSYVSITWPGFLGVTSGMNSKGLVVTFNSIWLRDRSNKGIPTVILIRKILRDASNIEDALSIIQDAKRLAPIIIYIGEGDTGRQVIVEATLDRIFLRWDDGKGLWATNHFISKKLLNAYPRYEKAKNGTNFSLIRGLRIKQLIESHNRVNGIQLALKIVRDHKSFLYKRLSPFGEAGLARRGIVYSVIFQPKKRLLWISGYPQPFGPFYGFNFNGEYITSDIPQDPCINDKSFLLTEEAGKKIEAAMRDYMKKNYSRSISYLKRAFWLTPWDYEAPYKIGYILMKERKYKEARSYFQYMISLNQGILPVEAASHALLGDIYRSEGKVLKAITHYRLALKIGHNRFATLRASEGLKSLTFEHGGLK